MTKRNPFRVIEKIGYIAFGVLCAACVGFALLAVAVACLREGWGWWTLLLIPGIPIGLVILMVIGGLLSGLVYTIQDRWRRAKGHWEYRHREVVRTADIFSTQPIEPVSGEAAQATNHANGSTT